MDLLDPANSGLCHALLKQFEPAAIDQIRMELSLGVQHFFLLSYCIGCCLHSVYAAESKRNNLRLVHQWREMEFVLPNEQARLDAIQKRFYVPGASVPIDVDVQHRRGSQASRVFVTLPRFDEGRPVTLGTVDDQGHIVPYPDYSWHDNQGSNCDGMTSVFRVAIDRCNRLWVMDTGRITEQSCPPQILAFSLDRDELIFRHKIAKKDYLETSLYITPVVDVRGSENSECHDTFVYVADVTGFGILVVDVARNRSWRVTHKLFFPYPSRGTFTIDGESFDLMDGVLGMALSPETPAGDRFLYFHALASTTENFVRASVLRNDSHIEDPNLYPNSVEVFPEERTSQSAAEAMDRNGILFFGLMDPPSIYCWNSATEFSRRNFHEVAIDQEALQFASGMKIVNNLKGEQELWIMTSSFQRVMTGSLNSERVNFRVHAEKIHNILRGSRCLSPPKDQRHGHHANRIMPTISRRSGHYKYGAVSYL